jgi:hypothetical protein
VVVDDLSIEEQTKQVLLVAVIIIV